MLKSLLVSLSLVSLVAAVPAQCGSLSATGSGTAGSSVTLDLTGSTPDAFAALVIGDTLGSTSLAFGPLGTLDLGLDAPFVPVPLGRTDSNGDASHTINVPIGFMQTINLHAQGVAFDLTIGQGVPSLSFCVSNTASFSVGGQ